MKLRSLLLALGFTLTITAAQAQIGLYVNPVAIRISNAKSDSGPFAFLGDTKTSRFFYGVDFGGFYQVPLTPKLDIGIDARDTYVNGNRAILNSFLVGLRVAGHPGSGRLKPYIQPSVGVGSTRSGLNPRSSSQFGYSIFAGLDYSIHRHVDFRAVEVGYGSLSTINSQLFQGAFAYPSSHLLTISSGLVFRLP
jgi:hypothetical protein